jgi:hypothetical protein
MFDIEWNYDILSSISGGESKNYLAIGVRSVSEAEMVSVKPTVSALALYIDRTPLRTRI